MKDKRSILLFDNNEQTLQQIKSALAESTYHIETITDSRELIAKAKSQQACIVIANPDAPGFNEYDVCKYIKKEMQIPVMLIISKASATRAEFGDCQADDVLETPIETNGLVNIIQKHFAMINN